MTERKEGMNESTGKSLSHNHNCLSFPGISNKKLLPLLSISAGAKIKVSTINCYEWYHDYEFIDTIVYT